MDAGTFWVAAVSLLIFAGTIAGMWAVARWARGGRTNADD